MTEHFREPTAEEMEELLSKAFAGEFECQSFATFTAQNGSGVIDEPLTLARLNEAMKRVEDVIGKEPIDTHIFVSPKRREWLERVLPIKQKVDDRFGLSVTPFPDFGEMAVWNDVTVPDNEVQIGRIEYQDEWPHVKEPCKVITKIVNIA